MFSTRSIIGLPPPQLQKVRVRESKSSFGRIFRTVSKMSPCLSQFPKLFRFGFFFLSFFWIEVHRSFAALNYSARTMAQQKACGFIGRSIEDLRREYIFFFREENEEIGKCFLASSSFFFLFPNSKNPFKFLNIIIQKIWKRLTFHISYP